MHGQWLYAVGHHAVYAFAFLDALTDLGAADVEQRRFHYGYARWHFSYVAPFSRIDDDGVVAQDVFVVKPFVEGSPVVASYEEGEADVGEGLGMWNS